MPVRREHIPVFARIGPFYQGCIYVALAKQSCLSECLPCSPFFLFLFFLFSFFPFFLFFFLGRLVLLALDRCTGVRTAYLRLRLELQVKLKILVHGRGLKMDGLWRPGTGS
jgi:hypothetical protein